MKKIKINFCDFSPDFSPENNDFIRILSQKYDVEISENPDFIFYSCFGFDYLKYHCVRIYYTGECIVPDFNICDYAIGFDYMSYGDRYCRIPLYQLFQYRSEYEAVLNRKENNQRAELFDRKFCSFVVSNDCGQNERKDIFALLSQYKTVSSGGKYLNNVGYRVNNKIDFLKEHKFNIAFENCVFPGYTTEKIIDAFAARTIPIYYGDPLVGKVFNEKAFINCHNYNSFEEIVEIVKELDCDQTKYEAMLNEPVFINESNDDELRDFLFSIFEQEPNNAIRRAINTKQVEREEWYRRIGCEEKLFFSKVKRLKGFIRRVKRGAL